jgi:predicted adenine nucleotide alpha hydrolase (AANH) superfamily ATPase
LAHRKLLFHTCCAPCSVRCIPALAAEGIKPDLYWYNPNIHPFTEYRSRRDSLARFARDEGLELIINDPYGLRAFLAAVYPDHAAPGDRCGICYRLRLEECARRAAATGYEAFSTSLLISPYQDHDKIRETGEEIARTYGPEFLYRDFRPYFREGQNQARRRGYYTQKYCGCVFSEEERYC